MFTLRKLKKDYDRRVDLSTIIAKERQSNELLQKQYGIINSNKRQNKMNYDIKCKEDSRDAFRSVMFQILSE